MSLSYWPPVCYTKKDIMNTYAILKTQDITKLAVKKAPACAILLYTLLLRYCQDKVSSYPSVKTLCRGLGDAYSERTVYRNLTWLCENGFVKRKHRQSKERWTIVSRLVQKTQQLLEKIVDAGEKVVKARSVKPNKKHGQPRHHKKITKNNLKFNNRKQKRNALPLWRTNSNYERFERPAPAVKTKGEEAWASLCMVSHPPDLSKASGAQKEAIIQGIQTGQLAWVLDVYPDILKEEKIL